VRGEKHPTRLEEPIALNAVLQRPSEQDNFVADSAIIRLQSDVGVDTVRATAPMSRF